MPNFRATLYCIPECTMVSSHYFVEWRGKYWIQARGLNWNIPCPNYCATNKRRPLNASSSTMQSLRRMKLSFRLFIIRYHSSVSFLTLHLWWNSRVCVFHQYIIDSYLHAIFPINWKNRGTLLHTKKYKALQNCFILAGHVDQTCDKTAFAFTCVSSIIAMPSNVHAYNVSGRWHTNAPVVDATNGIPILYLRPVLMRDENCRLLHFAL